MAAVEFATAEEAGLCLEKLNGFSWVNEKKEKMTLAVTPSAWKELPDSVIIPRRRLVSGKLCPFPPARSPHPFVGFAVCDSAMGMLPAPKMSRRRKRYPKQHHHNFNRFDSQRGGHSSVPLLRGTEDVPPFYSGYSIRMERIQEKKDDDRPKNNLKDFGVLGKKKVARRSRGSRYLRSEERESDRRRYHEDRSRHSPRRRRRNVPEFIPPSLHEERRRSRSPRRGSTQSGRKRKYADMSRGGREREHGDRKRRKLR